MGKCERMKNGKRVLRTANESQGSKQNPAEEFQRKYEALNICLDCVQAILWGKATVHLWMDYDGYFIYSTVMVLK